MVKTYKYSIDRNKKLSVHFSVWEFAAPSDYHGNYPENIPISEELINVLEDVYSHFNCSRCDILSGYRTPAIDIEVGGSGSGNHTKGLAADAYYYVNGKHLPSRLVSCYLQDKGVNGIGYCCGTNPNGTHIDVRQGSVWHGDERDYSITVADYYSYTGTKKSEVYPNSDIPSSTTVTRKTGNMVTSDKMVSIIKTEEGLSLRACKAIPSEQYWTIGYGHYGPEVRANQTITEPEAEALLRKDLKVFENEVNSDIKVQITQSQFDACISLSYNIGIGSFGNSDIVKYINEGKFGHACVEFPIYRRAGGQILQGLVTRRQMEMEFFGLGMNLTLTGNMNIRTGAGTNYPVKKVADITANGKEYVIDSNLNADAVFKKGTVVTALELKAISGNQIDVWCRCPSGWICIRQGNEIYVN